MINRDIGVHGWDQSCLGLMALPLKTPNSEIVCGQNMPNIFFMGVVLFISLFQDFHYQVQSFSEQYLRVQENTVKVSLIGGMLSCCSRCIAEKHLSFEIIRRKKTLAIFLGIVLIFSNVSLICSSQYLNSPIKRNADQPTTDISWQ